MKKKLLFLALMISLNFVYSEVVFQQSQKAEKERIELGVREKLGEKFRYEAEFYIYTPLDSLVVQKKSVTRDEWGFIYFSSDSLTSKGDYLWKCLIDNELKVWGRFAFNKEIGFDDRTDDRPPLNEKYAENLKFVKSSLLSKLDKQKLIEYKISSIQAVIDETGLISSIEFYSDKNNIYMNGYREELRDVKIAQPLYKQIPVSVLVKIEF